MNKTIVKATNRKDTLRSKAGHIRSDQTIWILAQSMNGSIETMPLESIATHSNRSNEFIKTRDLEGIYLIQVNRFSPVEPTDRSVWMDK